MMALTCGSMLMQTPDRFDPAETAADRGVEDDGRESFAFAERAFVGAHRLRAIGHGGHFVAHRREELRGQIANRGFVVHHQNALRCSGASCSLGGSGSLATRPEVAGR